MYHQQPFQVLILFSTWIRYACSLQASVSAAAVDDGGGGDDFVDIVIWLFLFL